MKRLYELNKGDKFKIQYDSPTTVPEYSKNYVFTFDKMDGAYGVVFDEDGNTQYLSAYSTVVLVGE